MNTTTKQTLIALTLVAAMTATAAFAQIAAAPAAATAVPVSANKAKHQEKFEERKAKKLEHLEKHAAEIQQKQACVQASTDNKSLDACFPNEGKWGKGEGKGEFKGEEGGAAPVAAPAAAPAGK